MGIAAFPEYTPGGRLQNYKGDPPLSDRAFRIIQSLVKAAAENLEQSKQLLIPRPWNLSDEGRVILALTRLTLEELASDEATARLRRVL